jgi:alpha/beta superfamily hydrolase
MPLTAPPVANETRPLEFPHYVESDGEQLYCVLHRAAEARALALLPPPFPTERPYAYTAWVKWARFLAEHGISTLRFDYRGSGESTGEFERMTIGTWTNDTHRLLDHAFPDASRTLPLLLHGLGFGGLVASQLFKRGIGQALLTWSAPTSGIEAMKEAFARRLMMDFVTAGAKRKTWDDYVGELETGAVIPVQGCPLSGAMWKEAQQYTLALSEAERGDRPVHQVKLGRDAAPLIAGIGQWRALNPALQSGYVPLNPDFTKLFETNLQWIRQSLGGMA